MEELVECLTAEQIIAMQGQGSVLAFGEDLTPYLTGRDILFAADADGAVRKRANETFRSVCALAAHPGPASHAQSAVQLAWLASEFRHLLDDREYEMVTRRWRLGIESASMTPHVKEGEPAGPGGGIFASVSSRRVEHNSRL